MRVMYLSASGHLGGAETSLLDILASLRRAEPSWPLHLLIAAPGPLEARATALGVATTVLPFPAAIARLGEFASTTERAGYVRLAGRLGLAAAAVQGYASRLRRAIDVAAPDVVHTNGVKMHLFGARASRAPVVWHIHDYLGVRPMTARLLRRHTARCSAIVANSASVAADITHALAPLGNVPVIPVLNAVDLQRFSPSGDRVDLDGLAGLPPAPPGTRRIGLLGTFARWKGHVAFLTAVSRLPRELPIRAYIIGDAVYQTDGSQYTRDELWQEAARLGIGDRVGFTGFVARPDAALRALDIVVHASTAPEPFGLVIAEAMACGSAVVASRAGGAAELITPEVDALAHAPGDVEGLAACLTALVTDPALRARLGRASRATAERAFNPVRLAAEIVPIYRDVVASPAPARHHVHQVRLKPDTT